MAFFQTLVSTGVVANNSGAGTNYLIETNSGVRYCVYIDANSDVMYKKSTDGGLSWGSPVTVFTGTALSLAVWYDRWSGLSTDLIHCAYNDNDADDCFYRSIDAGSSDTLSAQTTIFAGATAAGGACLSITRTRGGNILCAGNIDGPTEIFAKKSTDTGGTWGDIAALMESEASDQIILLPGFAADNQDAICIYWDASADEISRKLYDDSGNTWGETSISTGMVDLVATTAFPNFSAAVDLSNSYVILLAWTQADLANADLKCWTVSESAITAKTDVITNSPDDQGLAAVSLDTTNGDVYAYFLGRDDGQQSFPSTIDMYYRVSTDDMATWSASSTRMSQTMGDYRAIYTNPRMVYLAADLCTLLFCIEGDDHMTYIGVAPTIPAPADVESGVTYGINGVEFTGTFAAGSPGNANILRGSVVA